MSFERIKELLKLLSKKEYLKIGKIKETSFTRKRKITYKEIFLCILNKKGKTLTLELKEYMKKINKEEIKTYKGYIVLSVDGMVHSMNKYRHNLRRNS